ncbi:MAG TPA: BolA family protein [Nitrospiria bacterium]
MISSDALTEYIQKMMPDAEVKVEDRTGTMDHFRLRIVSEAFRDKGLLDRHRLVYQSLDDPMKDGRIHAVEIKALAPEENK